MEDVVVVSMEKSPWEAFTLSLTNGNFIENSICNIQFKSFENIDIRVDFSNGNTIFEGIKESIVGMDKFQNLEFDLSDIISSIDYSSNPYLIIYVNPGHEYSGEIMLKTINFTMNSEAEKESLSEQILDFELSVYPNPANDIINIEMPEGFEGEIVVRDISGRVVFESTVNNSFETICQANLSHLQSGSYFVSIIDDENLISKKIQLY